MTCTAHNRNDSAIDERFSGDILAMLEIWLAVKPPLDGDTSDFFMSVMMTPVFMLSILGIGLDIRCPMVGHFLGFNG